MPEQSKKRPLLSQNVESSGAPTQPTPSKNAKSNGAPAQPTLSKNAESSGTPAQPTLSENAKNSGTPLQLTLSENGESSSAPAQPTLSEKAESSGTKLTPLDICFAIMSKKFKASEKEGDTDEEDYDEEDDGEEDDEGLEERLKIKNLHCERCPAPSFNLRPCKCKNGRHDKGCALSDGGGNENCGFCGGPVACTHDIFGPSGEFIHTGSLPCGYCLMPAWYAKTKGV